MGSIAGLGAGAAFPKPAEARKKRITFDEVEVTPPNGINMIVIISDTFRWDYLRFNGVNPRIQTPNLDTLAGNGVSFDNCYADSLPSIPARRVMHTGNSLIGINPQWAPLLDDDITLAQILNKTHAFTTGIVSDFVFYFAPTYPYLPTFSFNQGFDGFHWIRGNVHDSYRTGPRSSVTDAEKHCPAHYMSDSLRERLFRYLLDTRDFRSEDDFFAAQVCRSAARWLTDNKDNEGPFLLFVDMFDPHEPWDAPPRFTKMYRKNYQGDRYLIDYDALLDAITGEDTAILTDHYAAEVTYVDHCIGQLLDTVKSLKLWDNTIIIFSSDHGTHLGEMGCVMKQAKLCNSAVARVPLIIRHPFMDSGLRGKRIEALTSHQDFTPTILGMLGIETNVSFDGYDMWDMATGAKKTLRDFVVTNYGGYGSVHTPDWHYFQNIDNEQAGFGPQLYDVVADRAETKNVVTKHSGVAEELKKIVIAACKTG